MILACSNPSCAATIEAHQSVDHWSDAAKTQLLRLMKWSGTPRSPLCPRCTKETL